MRKAAGLKTYYLGNYLLYNWQINNQHDYCKKELLLLKRQKLNTIPKTKKERNAKLWGKKDTKISSLGEET
jgi:hypothetical protein